MSAEESAVDTKMTLEVEDVKDGGAIPSRFTCDEDDDRPRFEWSGAPDGTKSFALSVIDYDVPKNLRPDGIWTHWLVVDIPADTTEIPTAGDVPGRQVENDFEKRDWGGPCPPDREHRYFFRVYALPFEKLEEPIDKKSFKDVVEKHALAKGQVVGRYERGAS